MADTNLMRVYHTGH